jgi:hypothetical protein
MLARTIGIGKHFTHDINHGNVLVTGLPELDEPGVFGEPAGIDKQRDAVTLTDFMGLADILHRYRLPATGVVGHRDHAQRNIVRTGVSNKLFQRLDIHVALERVFSLRVQTFFDHKIHSAGALRLDIGAGGVEMGVVGYGMMRFCHHRKQDAFSHRGLETVEGRAAGI